MSRIIAAGFIAHDPECIYGIGNSPDAARENAREWFTGDPALLAISAATDDLMRQVENIGGDECWGKIGPVCCTQAEAGDAE